MFAVGERQESLQKMLPSNEVAGYLSGIAHHWHSKSWRRHKGVPVCGGLRASNSCSTGDPWSKRVNSKDRFPRGVVILLLYGERTESTSVLFERFWGRGSWAGFHYFYVVRENGPDWIGSVILIGWKYATIITVKLIYAPNKNTKFFLLHAFSLCVYVLEWFRISLTVIFFCVSVNACLKICMCVCVCVCVW